MKEFPPHNRTSLGVLAIALAVSGCKTSKSSVDAQRRLESLRRELQTTGILDKDRKLIHLSFVGNLKVDGQTFAVLDIMELVPGASTPRGVNRIIILDPSLVAAQQIEYTTERPLFCQGSRLFVWGDLTIGGVLPEGNVLTFTDHGHRVSVSKVDFNSLSYLEGKPPGVPGGGTGR